MKKVYVLYTVKGGDGFEEVFPTMEDTIQAGLEALRGKDRYTQAIALELDAEVYLKYLEGELEGWLGDYDTDSVDIKKKSAFKRLLDEYNTTSYQVAKESGLAERHVYKIEAGDIDIMKMTATNIQALAGAFDMTTDEFIEAIKG